MPTGQKYKYRFDSRSIGATLHAMRCSTVIVGSIMIGVVSNADAFAQEKTSPNANKDWSIVLGGGGAAATTIYKADDDIDVSPVPIAILQWRQLELDPDGISLTVWERDDLSIDLSAGVRFAPGFPDTKLFAGLDRDTAVELGGRVSFDWGFATTGISFQHDVTGAHAGFEASFDIAKEFDLGRAVIGFGAGVVIQDQNLGTYLYGVEKSEANANRAAYTPNASFNPFVETSISVPITDRLAIVGTAEYQALDSTIQDSPLVDAPGAAAVGLFTVFKF